EDRHRPTSCRLPDRTVPYRKLRTRRRVHRIIRLLPGSQMTARGTATVQRGRQRIVVVDVTRNAGHAGMAIGKWEPCCAVIETCRRPTYGCVAYRTVPYRKLRTRRRVHRIIRLLPGSQMA